MKKTAARRRRPSRNCFGARDREACARCPPRRSKSGVPRAPSRDCPLCVVHTRHVPTACGGSSTASAAADEAAANSRVTVSAAAVSRQKGRGSRTAPLLHSGHTRLEARARLAGSGACRIRAAAEARQPTAAAPPRRPAAVVGSLSPASPRRRRCGGGTRPASSRPALPWKPLGGGSGAGRGRGSRPPPHVQKGCGGGRTLDSINTPRASTTAPPPLLDAVHAAGPTRSPLISASAFLGTVRSLSTKAPHLANPPPPSRW